MHNHYILDGHTPIAVDDLLEWAAWIEEADRRVALTQFDDCQISTVFLGLNHQYGDGPAILFEMMVFGGDHDGEERRYSTWEEAEAGHEAMVALVREREDSDGEDD